jgi:hypothetical protein
MPEIVVLCSVALTVDPAGFVKSISPAPVLLARFAVPKGDPPFTVTLLPDPTEQVGHEMVPLLTTIGAAPT